MVRQMILGIDTKGKYVVIELSKKGLNVKHLHMDELSGVEHIMLMDIGVSIAGDNIVGVRAVKSLLSSLEDNLILLDSAKISNVLDGNGEFLRVTLATKEYPVSFKDYITEEDLIFDTEDGCIEVVFEELEK